MVLWEGFASQKFRRSWHDRYLYLAAGADLMLYNAGESFCTETVPLRGADMRIPRGHKDRIELRIAIRKRKAGGANLSRFKSGSTAEASRRRYVFRFQSQEARDEVAGVFEESVRQIDLLPKIGMRNSVTSFRQERAARTARTFE